MRYGVTLVVGISVVAAAVAAGAVPGLRRSSEAPGEPPAAEGAADALLAHLGPDPVFAPEPIDPALTQRAAEVAWAFFEARAKSSPGATGLVSATEDYDRVSLWDVGSTLVAYHAAQELGLMDEAAFSQRTTRLLETLATLPLYDGAVLNKAYHADGRPAGADGASADQPTGWSALDLGRLLIALHVIRTHHPELAAQAERVVARMDLDRVVRDGVLVGEGPGEEGGSTRYQEGKLGYEQYAARGLALWGVQAPAALDMLAHALPVVVEGTPLLKDRRGRERLTSDPFVLLGLELGWAPVERRVSLGMLEAQRRRALATGRITIAGEDAIDRPPHYFYYYAVQQDGQPFTVGAHGSMHGVDVPPWVSAKAAWGWYALVPSEYTRRAVGAVAPAALPGRGWRSGVYEESAEPAGVPNLNTAAVILEAALYAQRSAPLVEAR